MTYDVYLVCGSLALILAIPSLVNAFSEGRRPRGAAIMALIGAGLVTVALTRNPGPYAWTDIPDAFIRVVAYFLN